MSSGHPAERLPGRWFTVTAAVAVVVGAGVGGLLLRPGPIAVEDLGKHCSPEGNRYNSAHYFGEISRVERVSSASVARASREAEIVDEEADVTAILSAPERQTVFADDAQNLPSTLWMARGVREEAVRLPEGLSVLIAIWQPDRVGAGPWVSFLIVEQPAGDLRFAGDCADGTWRQRLAGYRDEARPDDTLADIFFDVIANDAAWSDFNDWDLHQGPYDT